MQHVYNSSSGPESSGEKTVATSRHTPTTSWPLSCRHEDSPSYQGLGLCISLRAGSGLDKRGIKKRCYHFHPLRTVVSLLAVPRLDIATIRQGRISRGLKASEWRECELARRPPWHLHGGLPLTGCGGVASSSDLFLERCSPYRHAREEFLVWEAILALNWGG